MTTESVLSASASEAGVKQNTLKSKKLEQGTLCLQLAHNCDNENIEKRQCAYNSYNHMQPVSVKRGRRCMRVSLGTLKSPLSVLTGVLIKRVNFRENI